MALSKERREKILNLYAAGMGSEYIASVMRVAPATVMDTVRGDGVIEPRKPWTSESMWAWHSYGKYKGPKVASA